MHLHKIWILLAPCYIENTCCNFCKRKPLSIYENCHRW